MVRLGEPAATYGLGPKKNTEGYAYIMPHAKWINLGFFRGAALPDPGICCWRALGLPCGT